MMQGPGTAPRQEVTLPSDVFVVLLEQLREVAPDRLHEAGRAAGAALAGRLVSAREGVETASRLPPDLFWKRLSELFSSRGWGSLEHAGMHDGVGELIARDWLEAQRDDTGTGCLYTTGVLRGLLQRIAGADLRVEETACRASGADICRFVFGSEAAIRTMHGGRTAPSARA